MTPTELLEKARNLGAKLTIPGTGRLHVEAPEPLPDDFMTALKEQKTAIIEHIQHRIELVDLPWSIGYGGLPTDQVARAEASNDRLRVTDPVNRRLNVLMWMWSHYRDQGDMAMAGQMREAYHELRHADKSIQALCGLCEFQEL